MLEKEVERKCCKWARDQGWITIKLEGPNNLGKPDRLFLKDGRAVFIEFKKPGGKPTAKQILWINRLTKAGFLADVVDNLERLKTLLSSNELDLNLEL